MTKIPREVLARALATAARAPSPHNTQPWTVRVEPARITVAPDPGRWLRHGDPGQRDLRLALGAFVDALGIALTAEGVRVTPSVGPTPQVVGFDLAGDAPVDDAARRTVSLLRRRQTSRLDYAQRPLDTSGLAGLERAAREANLELHLLVAGAAGRAELNGLHEAGAREAWLDPRAVAELRRWVRLDPEGARRPEDGLSTHCLGLSLRETAALGAMVQPAVWRAARAAYAAPLLADALAATEARKFDNTPVVGVLVAPGPVDLGSGAGLLRIWLAATELGLAMAPTSVLVDRRGWELARRLDVSPQRLVAALRIGRSAPPPRSGRRAVPRFASFTSDTTQHLGTGVASGDAS